MRYKITRTTAGNGELFDPAVKPWPPRVVQIADSEGVLLDSYQTYINCNPVMIFKGTLLIYDGLGNVINVVLPGPSDPMLKIEREIEDRVWGQLDARL